MRRAALVAVALAGCAGGLPVPGASQELAAQVRTWGGQAWRLSQASWEILYTIVPSADEDRALPPPGATSTTSGSTAGSTLQVSGSMNALRPLLETRPEPLQARRPAAALTLFRDGVETRIPLAGVASVHMSRQRLMESALPPYVAPKHFRHAAVVTLVDGSRVEGDYVNLGTLRLRGTTPQGLVEVPWDEIESVVFER